jgi:hypothetical protein
MTNSLDLTWLLAVKRRAEVGLQPDGTIIATADDQEIQDAITGFSQYLLNWSGLGSLNSVVTLDESYNGNGNNRLMLRSTPILSLISVTQYGVAIPISTGPQAWGAYIGQSKKNIAIRGGVGNFSTFPYPYQFSPSRGPVFQRGTGNIQVQYTAGYPPIVITNEIDTIESNTITLQVGAWVSDGGVLYYPSLNPLTQVGNNPQAGEYAVQNGLYVFATADNGKQIAVTYTVNRPPYDLEYAVRCIVAINYKRKGWQDQKSRAISAKDTVSTVSYRDWEFPPEYSSVFDFYSRLAVIE